MCRDVEDRGRSLTLLLLLLLLEMHGQLTWVGDVDQHAAARNRRRADSYRRRTDEPRGRRHGPRGALGDGCAGR